MYSVYPVYPIFFKPVTNLLDLISDLKSALQWVTPIRGIKFGHFEEPEMYIFICICNYTCLFVNC